MSSPSIPGSPELDNELVDPRVWADETRIHERLTWLRHHDPVRRLEPQGYRPFWALTRHADIIEIERQNERFINDPRPTLAPIQSEEAVQHLTGSRHLVRSLVQMDNPDHKQYRALTQDWFMPANLKRMQTTVDALAQRYVDNLLEQGGECDFVQDVAIWYPLRVIMSILGVPAADEPYMMKLTQELFGAQDPDVQRSIEPLAIADVVRDFTEYFSEIARDRRRNPRDDVASVIANATIDGEPIGELEAASYYIIVATAGHDTTSASTAGGLEALLRHPEQLAKLRADPEGLMRTAVEESIRWVTPVRHFMRTATENYTLRDREIGAGESMILWYPSANRDEAIFEDPFTFRVDRRPNRQLAFGYGAHVCLGQHLARMEMSAMFRELFSRLEHVELAGEPRWTQSTFVGGLKRLPIRYRVAR